MPKSLLFRPRVRLATTVRGILRGFLRRTEGMAAVEFALIVPIMATMFIGAVEMSQAITASRRVAQVASSTGDLVARDDSTITDAQLADIMDVGAFLLAPYPANTLTVTISVVGSSATNALNTKLEWQCVYQGTNPGNVSCTCPQSGIVIPAGLVTASDYVVMATASYKYKPPVFDVFMKTGYGGEVGGMYTMNDTVYLKPRASVPALTVGAGPACAMPAF